MSKRKRDAYGGQLTPFTNARYKRGRSAGAYSQARRRASTRYRNYRTGGYIGIEKKFYDTSQSVALAAPTDCSGGEVDPTTINCLSAPPIGDDEKSRDGRKIVAKYLQIKGEVVQPALANQVAGTASLRVFVACVLDTQTNGAQMNSEDCFTNPNATAGRAADPLRKLEYAERFKILKSEVFVLEPAWAAWDGTNIEVAGTSKAFDWYIPLKNLKITFNGGTTAVIGSVMDNSIHMIAFATSATNGPTINYNARMRFVG